MKKKYLNFCWSFLHLRVSLNQFYLHTNALLLISLTTWTYNIVSCQIYTKDLQCVPILNRLYVIMFFPIKFFLIYNSLLWVIGETCNRLNKSNSSGSWCFENYTINIQWKAILALFFVLYLCCTKMYKKLMCSIVMQI